MANMSFTAEPLKILPDKAALLTTLADPAFMEDLNHWHVKSQWLCDEMDVYEKEHGFVYNRIFQEWLEKREGWPKSEENGSPLSLLIYNAQTYRRHDRLVREGYEPLTQEKIATAYLLNKKIEIKNEGLLGVYKKILIPRKIGEIVYAMEPRKRKFAIRPEGQPCKLLD
jgi:hypothetical protein